MERKNYSSLSQFENVYLEDSFVISIKTEENQAEFMIEAVLHEKHPLYSPPSAQEQYCYKLAKISFSNAKKVTWIEKKNSFFIDANNEVDYGNIDNFFYIGDHFYLSGDWGSLEIVKPLISFEFIN